MIHFVSRLFLLLFLLSFVTTNVVAQAANSTCYPSRCLSGSEVDPSLKNYVSCVQKAGNSPGFRCRCNLIVRDCLLDTSLGNCSEIEAKNECRKFSVRQHKGCSDTLCNGALRTTTVSVGTLILAALVQHLFFLR